MGNQGFRLAICWHHITTMWIFMCLWISIIVRPVNKANKLYIYILNEVCVHLCSLLCVDQFLLTSIDWTIWSLRSSIDKKMDCWSPYLINPILDEIQLMRNALTGTCTNYTRIKRKDNLSVNIYSISFFTSCTAWHARLLKSLLEM